MLKCKNCGEANDDGQKFCSECGSKLVADEQTSATEETSTVQDRKEAATEKVCPACGSKNGADEKFCSECGKPLDEAVEPTTSEEPKKEYKNKLVGTVAGVKDKTMAFENKHHVIGNALIAVMALVFALIALIAPVKYTLYNIDALDMYSAYSSSGFAASSSDYDDWDYDDDAFGDLDEKIVERVAYLAVNQSVFNAIGAAQAFTIDLKDEAGYAKYEKYMAEFSTALMKGMVEFYAWMEKHPEALEWDEEKLYDKAMDFVAKPLSKINLMRVEALTIKYQLLVAEMAGDSEYASEIINALMGDIFTLAITLVFAGVVSILAIVMAIISLVYLIRSIMGIVGKKPSDNGLFKFICSIMCIAASAVALISMAPELKVGGGMLAIMVLGAVLSFVLGTVSAFVNKVHNPLAIIKNMIIGALVIIAYFLLCTDIVTFKMAASKDISYTVYGPLGYAMYTAFQSFAASVGSGEGSSLMGVVGSGVFVAVMLGIAISLFGSGMARRLRYNACGLAKRKNGETVKDAYGTSALIGGIVVGLIGVLYAFIGSPIAYRTMYEKFYEPGALPEGESMSFGVRAQVFVSIIFTFVAMVFSAVFKPENFGKKKEKAPATEEAKA